MQNIDKDDHGGPDKELEFGSAQTAISTHCDVKGIGAPRDKHRYPIHTTQAKKNQIPYLVD